MYELSILTPTGVMQIQYVLFSELLATAIRESGFRLYATGVHPRDTIPHARSCQQVYDDRSEFELLTTPLEAMSSD